MESRRYRLNRSTLGVCSDGEKRFCATVPANEVIEVAMPDILEPKQTVQVRWCNRVLTMFSEDILERGTPMDDTPVQRNSPASAVITSRM